MKTAINVKFIKKNIMIDYLLLFAFVFGFLLGYILDKRIEKILTQDNNTKHKRTKNEKRK
ncbi:Uncharacterised protein [Campylobacter hominis]|uniref:Uncharacterized protein n=1 Tax=Campylobacter hominis (strain ATCC BAA-381 / DSM 21671 / CCUG 45161 / LMG 19568 / NCTC 13146 / CH001A) TaxID=360107 RepID=A7HZS5_CAMHC|nr:hypothetical protein CHAB381_0157 [Campylobacter hominis ATCC BAA-381]SUW84316.1 Uncharacterised protein [Campylobacter hominis]